LRKHILCIDFDGTIHSYVSGWRGLKVIPDPPTPGAIEAIARYMEEFTVCIISTRFAGTKWFQGMKTVTVWLTKHGIDSKRISFGEPTEDSPADNLYLVSHKPKAFVTIDDRAITFDGTWPDVATLRNFKPWNKRDV
jgi:hypothetical protein